MGLLGYDISLNLRGWYRCEWYRRRGHLQDRIAWNSDSIQIHSYLQVIKQHKICINKLMFIILINPLTMKGKMEPIYSLSASSSQLFFRRNITYLITLRYRNTSYCNITNNLNLKVDQRKREGETVDTASHCQSIPRLKILNRKNISECRDKTVDVHGRFKGMIDQLISACSLRHACWHEFKIRADSPPCYVWSIKKKKGDPRARRRVPDAFLGHGQRTGMTIRGGELFLLSRHSRPTVSSVL